MLSGYDIVYFGNDWHADNRTSGHQVARQLAARNRVLYVESAGSRAPRVCGRDFGKIVSKVGRWAAGPQQAMGDCYVWPLLLIPFNRLGSIRDLNKRLLLGQLRFVCNRMRFKRPIVWSLFPDVWPLIGKLDERLVVYYVVDDYARLPLVDAQAVRAAEEQMLLRSDVVFVTAEPLLDSRQGINPNVHLSPHGVDVEHFGRALDPDLPVPSDIASRRRPVIGFFGLLEEWIDLDLLLFIATARPNWSIVLIGRVAVDLGSLADQPNVYCLGSRPYRDMPGYAKAFDVSIIPFRQNELTRAVNPIKLYEYLAAGKPVVSTRLPEVEKLEGLVALADTKQGFLARVEEALATDGPREVKARTRAVAGLSWPARVDRLSRIVTASLNAKERGGDPATAVARVLDSTEVTSTCR